MIDDAYHRVIKDLEDQAKQDIRIIKERAKITQAFDKSQRKLSECERVRNKEHTLKLEDQIKEQRRVRESTF